MSRKRQVTSLKKKKKSLITNYVCSIILGISKFFLPERFGCEKNLFTAIYSLFNAQFMKHMQFL